MIIAGEASGDLHGAALIKKLRAKEPGIQCEGIGGSEMIAEGFNAHFHIRDMAFLGFVEVLKHLPFIRRVQKELLNQIISKDIKTIVFIDYPGFNLNFAKKVKKLGLKVIYYISPQIWAWGKNRIKKIQKLVDQMIVVFPFEKDFYEKYNVNVEFVGHPLVERISDYDFVNKDKLYEDYKLDSTKDILLLMPGSRKQEISRIFPQCLKAANMLCEKFNLQTVVACPENIDINEFEKHSTLGKYSIIQSRSYDLMKHAKFGIIKSGTSTLEAGLFNLPFVVVYSTSKVTYAIGKFLIKIKNIAMANIILGKTVVKEFIQNDVNAENLFKGISEVLRDEKKYNTLKTALSEIHKKLGTKSASENAAGIILKFING